MFLQDTMTVAAAVLRLQIQHRHGCGVSKWVLWEMLGVLQPHGILDNNLHRQFAHVNDIAWSQRKAAPRTLKHSSNSVCDNLL